MDLLEEDDFFSGERDLRELEWVESSSLVSAGLFFDFLEDLEKSGIDSMA